MKHIAVIFALALSLTLPTPSISQDLQEPSGDQTLSQEALQNTEEAALMAWYLIDATLVSLGGVWFGVTLTLMQRGIHKLPMTLAGLRTTPLPTRLIRGGALGILLSGIVLAAILDSFRMDYIARASEDVRTHVTPSLMVDLFVGLKFKKLAWSLDPDNPYLEAEFLITKKIYQESAREVVSNNDFPERPELSRELNNVINDIDQRQEDLRHLISSLSREKKIVHLQSMADILDRLEREHQREEIRGRTERAIELLGR